jgi:hypothetical protein
MARVLSGSGTRTSFEDRSDRQLTVRGRLKAGATLESARSELALVAEQFQREFCAGQPRPRRAAVHTLFEMRTQGTDGNWKFGVIFLPCSRSPRCWSLHQTSPACS